MKRRNSQFGVFFGHGSVGEHEAPMGAEKSAVSYWGHRAASRRPPAQAKESSLQSLVRLFHKNHNSAGSQEEITGEYLQKAFQQGILSYYQRGNQICVPARCKITLLSSRDFHLLPPAARGNRIERWPLPRIQLQTDEKTNQVTI